MPEPKIAGRAPVAIDLQSGEDYFWCSCGLSEDQPFCDGSHAGTGFAPVKFSVDESGEAWLCRCKQTGTAPYCDGSHANLPTEESEPAPPGKTKPAGAPVGRNTAEEPHIEFIHALAKDGLEKFGHHGPMGAMGVPREKLPLWDDIQILTAQMATKPLQEEEPVGTELIIGPNAIKPLRMDIPLFVSDMSFGALSEEAKIALAKGAERVGAGICSGEGGMLPEEQEANRRYLYELASAKFGYRDELIAKVQAFHFKGGQGAKTGTGGHLPGNKVVGKIAKVRQLPEGTAAVSPPTFRDMSSAKDFRDFAEKVRELSSGIP